MGNEGIRTDGVEPTVAGESSARTAAEPVLRIEGMTKSFGGLVAVREVSIAINAGEYFCLLGGSGCGKTTLLRMMAGLETPDAGRVFIDGRDVTELPPYRRPVNMMFQSYALFPHYNVYGNVAYGLRQERLPRAEVRERAAEALALVGLEAFAKRKPDRLSGGQRQRVALARVLVKRPRLLLLDEPLAALDKNLRERTQMELARIHEQLGIVFVMVTHDQQEAMNLSTRIAVMRAGELVQVGSPREIYSAPADRYVAGLLGSINLFVGRVVGQPPQGGGSRVRIAVAGLDRSIAARATGWRDTGRCWLGVRPESVAVVRHPSCEAGRVAIQATVERVSYLGAQSVCQVRASGGMIVRAVWPAAGAREFFAPGDAVWVEWPEDDVVVLNS